MRMVISVRLMVAAGCVSGCLPAWGQLLSDPTRPPQEWLAAQQKDGGAAVSREPDAGPQLQSLLIGAKRRYAIIEGELVGVGDTFRDAKVIAVRPSEVVLRSERGTQTLKLYPAVDVRAAKTAPVRPTVTRAEKKGSPEERRSIVIKESK